MGDKENVKKEGEIVLGKKTLESCEKERRKKEKKRKRKRKQKEIQGEGVWSRKKNGWLFY